ncbi:Uncharacterised protein [Algoriella xinjiangensis]|uniref:hypothetical protein n=1 Tax=Algoriella xinjiangensis TaxID=684065 RepID=UPI000FB3DADE|nr:hypothetical protein [Algoriella xinjiangensis]VDH15472.1 Uncharacterised protein [Algoriella xinjiangensis]
MNYTKLLIGGIIALIISTIFLFQHFNKSEQKDYKEKIKQNTELIQKELRQMLRSMMN